MELLVLAFVPFLLLGLVGANSGGGDETAAEPDPETPDNPDPSIPETVDSASPSNPLDQVLRDSDAAVSRGGGEGRDLMLGAGGADTLSGDDGADTLAGETGADQLSGGAGDDLLLGAWGQDDLYGGSGFDTLSGGSGDDLLAGGTGDDDLFGSSGADTLVGDEGSDILIGVDVRTDIDTAELIGIDLGDLEAELDAVFGVALKDSDQQRVAAGVQNGDPAEDGSDLLIGDGGDDLLIADRGDLVTGGEGRDEFGVFYTPGDTTPVEIGDYDPTREVLQIIVSTPVQGAISYRDDAFLDGVEVILDDQVVAYLEGVRASQIDPNLLRLAVIDL